MVNDYRSPIPQVEENKKQYTARNLNRACRASRFQNIIVQPVSWILNAFDNNILQNIPILQEDSRMAEDMYRPRVPHLQGKTFRHKIKYLEPIITPNFSKGILYKYKNSTLWCDLININGIVFLNIISRNVMFETGSMIKI